MADGHYLVLARKWRPQAFDSVVGQQHITKTLQNAIESGRIGHAFLFIGSRGIGKTTTARILAKALNCLEGEGPTPNPCDECGNCTAISHGNSIDVVEIDGASNNSVEDVRQIREAVQLVPSNSRYKIYIIDEVHQLSPGAFNALLKTLEEPPAHAIFILATTEAHKVPATIISRCQRYDFRRVGMDDLIELLRRILEAEGTKYTDDALYAIARAADGGIRDAESILEQVISYAGDNLTYESVYDVLGLVEWSLLHDLCDAMINKDIAAQLTIIEGVVSSGKDLPQFIQEILSYYRNLLVCKTADPHALLTLPESDINEMQARAQKFSLVELIRLVEQFADLFKRDFDAQMAPRIALEALLIRCSKVAVEVSLDTVFEKLEALGAGGITLPPGEAPPPDPPKPLPTAPKAEAAPAPERNQQKQEAPSKPATPPPAKKAATPKAAPKKASINDPAAAWRHVVESGKVSERALLAPCKLINVEDGVAIIEAPYKSQALALLDDEETRTRLIESLAEHIDGLTGLRVKQTDPPKEDTAKPAKQPATITPRQADLDGVLEDPLVANVLEVFKGEVIEVESGEAKEPPPEE